MANSQKKKAKFVLSYAHVDRRYLKPGRTECQLLRYLRYAADSYDLEFWWDEDMNHSLFDAEIKRQFNEAKVIVLLVSVGFLQSRYIKKVERKIAARRQARAGVIVVPVMLDQIPGGLGRHPDLARLHRLPVSRPCLRGQTGQANLAYEIADHIMERLDRYRAYKYSETPALRTLRQRLDENLTKKERSRLKKDACERARACCPDENVRLAIREAAQADLKKTGRKRLSKAQMESLDERFLLASSRRSKPDPKCVRWVLRCYGLHPQGRG